MMLNGVLAQGQAPGHQQPQQQAVSGPGLFEQQQQGGDAAAMDVDDSDSVQPPAGKLAHVAQSIQLSSMYSRMPSPSHRIVSCAGHADALLELDLYLNNRDSYLVNWATFNLCAGDIWHGFMCMRVVFGLQVIQSD